MLPQTNPSIPSMKFIKLIIAVPIKIKNINNNSLWFWILNKKVVLSLFR